MEHHIENDLRITEIHANSGEGYNHLALGLRKI